jgi:hypothetical protein
MIFLLILQELYILIHTLPHHYNSRLVLLIPIPIAEATKQPQLLLSC